MTATTWLVVVLVGWVALGGFLAMLLGRRGFDSFSWFLIGIVLGPMALLVAWNCIRRDEQLSPAVIRTTGKTPEGLSVLIGFDGSAESRAAVAAVERTFARRLGRVVLASVVRFDDAPDHEHDAVALLESAGRAFAGLDADLMILRGHPSTALAEAARLGGFDLVAVGATGHGRAHLFGSAAKELIQRCPVPVLVAGQSITHAEGPTTAVPATA